MAAMTGLLLLLWAGVAVGSVVDLQKRIIGGYDCPDKERQHHVKLISHNRTHESLCGGSLIGPEWVLTAAHCWNDEPGWSMTAYVGVHPGKDQEPLKVLDHIPYLDHDIMLLKIETPKKKHPVVQLPDCANRPKANVDKVQVAGFGRSNVNITTNEKVKVPLTKLQCGEMTVVDCDDPTKCVASGELVLNSKLKETWLCYKDQAKKVDTGPGDSGGGVVFNNRIHGVHVAGSDYACVGKAIAMNVCYDKYLKWITDETGIKPTKSCLGCMRAIIKKIG